MSTPEEVQEQLAALRANYQIRLNSDLADLHQTALELSESLYDHVRLKTLRDGLHRISGSAGSFGCASIGLRCRDYEQRTQMWLDSSATPEAARMLELCQGLSVLKNELEQMIKGGGEASAADVDVPALDSPVRISLVGNESSEHRGIADALEGFGYAVTLDSNPKALAQGGARPDVVIADYQSLDPELSALFEPKGAPALILLDRTDSFDRRLEAVRHHAKGYFVYPIDIPRLEARIRRLASRHTQDPYRVVIVDDDAELSEHFRLVLEGAGIDSRVVNEPSHIVAALRDHLPDILIVDINMPGCSGPELAQVLRLDDDWLKVPIIYLSAETDQDRRALAMRQAGDDFLAKPIGDSELVNAIKVRAQRSRQLSEALERDGLTGLMKHAALKEQLEIEVSRAQRMDAPASVVMIDIDRFKSINDTYGHATGDYVIRLLANLLRRRLRKLDTVGRYGGEEFVAILPNCSLKDAERIFNEIRLNFSQLDCVAGKESFRVSFSAGIAPIGPSSHGAQVLEAADQAMYEAKTGGRNQVRVAVSAD
ncbi:diguanylate cyclase [Larsenimonas suaedae]|uniref:diguanylate cyclase n=1 Tax=Larsenimonas suaedae TaxID=1851019 RepID=A0ABU1GT15_9GAMM|nr:diguanylate cyclase [Larsenimonas suaedae]MCM2972087.1 diguanylate cyclase [Larsenimonas suaedae]MDR5895119.1 diguanylate cyclase [Larsenimonas suaedae]